MLLLTPSRLACTRVGPEFADEFAVTVPPETIVAMLVCDEDHVTIAVMSYLLLALSVPDAVQVVVSPCDRVVNAQEIVMVERFGG